MRSPIYRKIPGVALAVAGPWVVGGCGNLTSCTMDFRYGIKATLIDAATTANITPGAYLIVREGSYRDSVSADPMGQLRAAGERAGIYTVTIGHPGYASFTQSTVVVRRDACHVVPVSLTARLLRNS